MPFQSNPNKSAGSDRTNFHGDLHRSFTDARRDMNLARKAIGTAEWTFKERIEARNNAYTRHGTLYLMAQKGQLSASVFKELNDAEDTLRELNVLFFQAEAQLADAQRRYTSRVARFGQAKSNCEDSGCPEEHDATPGRAEFSKEEHKARKAAKEEQQRGWKQDKENQDKEARQRRAFEEATKKPSHAAKPTNPAKKPGARPTTYADWIAASKAALKDYASLSKFPAPPARPCPSARCAAEITDSTRVSSACACNIKQGLHFMSASELKDFRLLFHPDKFSKCHADKMEVFKKKASEVFVVVDGMYQLRR